MFLTLVHDNAALMNIIKFHYLQNSLTRKAAALIKTLEFDEKYYSAAWAALIDKYDNEKAPGHRLKQRLFEIHNPCSCRTESKLTQKL